MGGNTVPFPIGQEDDANVADVDPQWSGCCRNVSTFVDGVGYRLREICTLARDAAIGLVQGVATLVSGVPELGVPKPEVVDRDAIEPTKLADRDASRQTASVPLYWREAHEIMSDDHRPRG